MKNSNKNNLSMGYGFIEFAKKEDAIKALKTFQVFLNVVFICIY